MSRLILCLRVCDRPIPHVPSTAVHCATCHQPAWLDANCGSEAGDEYICTACFPGYEEVKKAARAGAIVRDHASVTEVFRAMAESHGLLKTEADRKPKGPPS